MAIKHNYLNTADLKPQVSEIEQGELVPNLADGTLWSKNTGGTVIQISPVLSGYLLNTTDTLTGDLTVTGLIDSLNFEYIDNTSIAISPDGTALASDDKTSNYNIGIGHNALTTSTTGVFNTGIGAQALEDLTTGISNVGVGQKAGLAITTGDYNTFLGYSAGGQDAEGGRTIPLTGDKNVGIGHSSLKKVTTGIQNTAIGNWSADNLTTGSNNVFIGHYAGDGITSQSNQLRIANTNTATLISGDFSLETVTIDGDIDADNLSGTNTGDQDLSGYLLNTTDTLTGDLTVTGNLDSTNFKTIDSSIAISADNSALVLDDGSANLNIGIGTESLKNAVTASKNVCIGPYTGRYITGASLENVFIGYLSGGAYRATAADTTGSNNVGIGKTALGKITSGDENIALGSVAGENMTAGSDNIALGTQALKGATAGVTGNRNIVLGYQCGYDVTSASDNILIGTNSGTQLSTGLNNIFIGIHSGESDISTNVTGDENISFGSYSLSSITSGSYNIALGQNAGKNLTTENNQLRIGNIDVDVTDKGLIEGDISLGTVTVNGDFDTTGTGDFTGDVTTPTLKINDHIEWDTNFIEDHNRVLTIDSGVGDLDAYLDIGEGYDIFDITPTGSSYNYLVNGIFHTINGTSYENIEFELTIRSNTLPSLTWILNYNTSTSYTAPVFEPVIWYDGVAGSLKLIFKNVGQSNVQKNSIDFKIHKRGVYTDITQTVSEHIDVTSPYVGYTEYAGNLRSTYNNTGMIIEDDATFNGQIESTVADGIAPLVIASTTLVNNLNAESLNGITSSKFLQNNTGTDAEQTVDNLNLRKYIHFNDFDDATGSNTGLRTYVRDGTWNLLADTGEVNPIIFNIEGKIIARSMSSLSLAVDGALTLGDTADANLAFDTNDVQARNNGANSALYLNRLGGNVSIGESGTTTDSHTLHGKTTINLIDTVVDSAFSGVKINHTLSGSDVATADKNHIGFHVNTSSTASGGDTANEHRIYGTYSTVTASGDSDLIWGGYSRGISTLGNTGETVSLVGGITATGLGYNTDGTVSNVYGIQGFCYNDSAGVVTNMYGLYGKATIQSTAGTTSTAIGAYAELETTEGGAAITIGYGIRSVIDNNVTTSPESAIGTSYLFHGIYQGTVPTNAYGIYINDAVDNHLGGDLNIDGHTDVYTISGTGNFETTGQVIAGLGGGGVALTINDGYGNANVAFNHASGIPEQSGSSARIDFSTDSTTAQMDFSMQDNTVVDTAVGLTTIVGLNTTSIALNKATTVTGNFTATGDIVFSGLSASTGDILKYDGAKWVAGKSEVTNHDFDATAGQTVFTCAYNVDDVEVYVDGIKLRVGASYDYTATNGTSVTLTQAQDLNTWVQVVTR